MTEKKSVSPWTVIGWIFVVFLCLPLVMCVGIIGVAGTSKPTPSPEPAAPPQPTAVATAEPARPQNSTRSPEAAVLPFDSALALCAITFGAQKDFDTSIEIAEKALNREDFKKYANEHYNRIMATDTTNTEQSATLRRDIRNACRQTGNTPPKFFTK